MTVYELHNYELGPYSSLPSEGHSLTCLAVILLFTKNANTSIVGTLLGMKEAMPSAKLAQEETTSDSHYTEGVNTHKRVSPVHEHLKDQNGP